MSRVQLRRLLSDAPHPTSISVPEVAVGHHRACSREPSQRLLGEGEIRHPASAAAATAAGRWVATLRERPKTTVSNVPETMSTSQLMLSDITSNR